MSNAVAPVASARSRPARRSRAGCSSSPVASSAATTCSATAARRAPRRDRRRAQREPTAEPPAAAPAAPTPRSTRCLAREVDAEDRRAATTKLTWAELGVEIDPDEVARGRAAPTSPRSRAQGLDSRCASIATRRVKALARAQGADTTRAPINAYLDLEARKIHDDTPGQGIDVWGSLPRHRRRRAPGAPASRARRRPGPRARSPRRASASTTSRTCSATTRRSSRSPTAIATSTSSSPRRKINGVVLKPGEEWSFNGTVGERSQKTGYKIAHVITAGEMVDGLAGGTCQISTTLFGAAFFAGLDIVKTTNHSRPSAYTPLGFDATVVWPNTDLKLKNPYDFPVVDPLPSSRTARRRSRSSARRGRTTRSCSSARSSRRPRSRPRSASTRRCPKDETSTRPGRLQRLQARALPPFYKGKQDREDEQVDRDATSRSPSTSAAARTRIPRRRCRRRRRATAPLKAGRHEGTTMAQ